MKIALTDLRNNILATLREKNFADADAEQIADYIIWAEMSGNATQGLIKLTGTEPLQNITPQHEPTVLRDTKLSQLIAAGAHPAPLIATRAARTAISKARASGFSIVGVRGTYSSNGAQAYYAELIAREDLIGIVCSRSPASTSGFGSIDPIFGTNPIGFGFPTESDPLVFDMATSAMTFYGLVLSKARGETIPDNTAIDHDGNPTTDPAAAMKGALLPFDHGYKGAGLGMVIELLAGPLLGGAWVDNKTFTEEWGSVFIAIDPNLLIDTSEFKRNASQMIADIKSVRSKDDIRLPGERALAARHAAEVSGFVDVEEAVLRELGYVA